MSTEKVHLKPQCSGNYRGLPAARQKLLRLMQENPFSRIEHLAVVNGEPQFEQTTKVIAEHKFGANDGPRREAELTDFVLKKEHIELFKRLEVVGSGVILALEVRGGMPFRMQSEVAA
jgi:hypothetical protein